MKRAAWISGAVLAAATIASTLPAAGAFQQNQPPANTPPANAKEELPPGPGKDTFLRICSGCHLTSVATTQRKTADGWTDTVIEMRNRGANASDDDLEQIVQYLATNFGPVNINTAAASDIATVLSVPQAEAESIVAYRNKNGKFKDIAALKLVPGVEIAKVDAAKDRILF
jgi:competence protein ComEA